MVAYVAIASTRERGGCQNSPEAGRFVRLRVVVEKKAPLSSPTIHAGASLCAVRVCSFESAVFTDVSAITMLPVLVPTVVNFVPGMTNKAGEPVGADKTGLSLEKEPWVRMASPAATHVPLVVLADSVVLDREDNVIPPAHADAVTEDALVWYVQVSGLWTTAV